MDNVNSQFHSLVTDGLTEQILLLVECVANGGLLFNYYLSSDGDMSTEGATFTDEMSSGDNYALGCVPSRTMKVSLMNIDGHLNGHSYGWLHAFIGVLIYHGEETFASGVNAAYDYVSGNQDWDGLYECRTDGFYRDNTLIDGSGNCTGAFTSDDGFFYYFIEDNGKTSCYVYDCSNGIIRPIEDTQGGNYITEDFIGKFTGDGHIVNVSPGGRLYIDIHHEYSDSYRLCDMGHFRVDRPNRTLGKTIEITDAFDPIHELDVDASTVLASTNAADGYALLNALLSYGGLGMAVSDEISARLHEIAVDPTELQKNSYTCRKLVSYLLEAVGCNGRLKTGTNNLYVYTPFDATETLAYPIYESRIASASLEIQEYISHAVDRVSVKNLAGETTMYPSVGEWCYAYDGNPFVSKANFTQFCYVRQIPNYQPMHFSLLEADPSFQAGDLIKVEVAYDEELELYDSYDRGITTYDLDIIAVTPNEGKWIVPLMVQTIHWNGKASAEYEAKGSEERSGYKSGGDYTDVNARVRMTKVSELDNDAGYLTLATLPIYGADVQIVYDGEVS